MMNNCHEIQGGTNEIIDEAHRRVTVYYDALKNSNKIYESLYNAYSSTPYSFKNKYEYISGIAQGFLSLLLSGDDTNPLEEDNIDVVKQMIDQNFKSETNDKVNNIKIMLLEMIKIGYPKKNINTGGLFNELQTAIGELFYLINEVRDIEPILFMIEKMNCNTLLFDLILIKNKFSYIIWHSFKTSCFYDTGRIENDTISLEDFLQVIDKTISLVQQVQQIQQEENQLINLLSKVIANDNALIPENKEIHQLITRFLKNTKIACNPEIILDYNEIYNNLFFRDEGPTLGNKINLFYQIDTVLVNAPNLYLLLKEYNKYIILKKMDSYLGVANNQQLLQDKIEYGAKGSYLNAISSYVEKLNKYIIDHDLNLIFSSLFKVPNYENISICYYQERKKTGILHHQYFELLYKRWQSKKTDFIIRSSAVYSEDNDTNTGAGIYESIQLNKNVSYEEFCSGIEAVYRSCDSQKALQYRIENNIENESMGLCIQEYCTGVDFGHINSVMQHRPELMESVSGKNKGFRAVIDKNQLYESLFNSDAQYNELIYYYKLDNVKYGADIGIIHKYISQIIYLLERHFQKNIQGEYIVENYTSGEFASLFLKTTNLVQIRPLPVGFSQPVTIKFPNNIQQIRSGRCLGVGDAEYDVLPTGGLNNEKVGIVIFKGNKFGSNNTQYIEQSLPKSGAVLILQEDGYQGHIETICAEKGIVFMFPIPKTSQETRYESIEKSNNFKLAKQLGMQLDDDDENFINNINSLDGYTTLRIVANGLEGRVYGID